MLPALPRRFLAPLLAALLVQVLGACALPAASGTSPAPEDAEWFLTVNLAGGWADGAELHGVDANAAALVERVRALDPAPVAVFLQEACASQAASVAAGLGGGWRSFFTPTWPGRSDCYPAPGSDAGQAGNAVLVRDPSAAAVTIPSCNDPGADPARCLPNWAPPAEQRRAACAAVPGRLLCSVHLDPVEWEHHGGQLAAIGRIAADLVPWYGSVVVGGDLNVGMGAVERAFEASGVVAFTDVTGADDPRTYPARAPDRDLDHVVLLGPHAGRSAGARTIDLGRCDPTWREDGRCTDHLALLAGLAGG